MLVGDPGAWRCIRASPSRRSFVAGGITTAAALAGKPAPDDIPLADVLATACALAGVATVSVLAVDMPLSRIPVLARRPADTLVSRAYGSRGCAVHSPTPARPGPLAARIRDEAHACGLPLVTQGSPQVPALIEVYPHVSLLRLLDAKYRVAYKVARARKYWPKHSSAERRTMLVGAWQQIERALEDVLGPLPPWVELGEGASTRALEAYEDALDGIVCAWTAALYLEARAMPMGDDDAAIWVPA